MNDNEMSNRDYHDYRDYDYRDYRDNYREDYRDYRNYRDDYRTRDYDRRGGKINRRDYRDYRNYRNYREEDYREELEMACEDIRDTYRKLEDISEMVNNPQDKNVIMKVAQAEKENYNHLKQIMK